MGSPSTASATSSRAGDSIHFRTLLPHSWSNPPTGRRAPSGSWCAPPERIMRIVIAVGGNALIRAGEAGTWAEQLANVREIAEAVLALRAERPRGRAHARQRPAGRRAAAAERARRGRGGAAAARRADRDDAGPDRLPARERVRRGRPRACRPPCCSRACSSIPTTTRSAPRPSRSARSTTPTRRAAARSRSAGTSRPTPGRGWRRVVPSPRPRKVLGEEHVSRAARARRRW